MRTINSEVEPIAYQERARALPEDSLDHLAKGLSQVKELISQSALALTRIEQRLSSAQQKQTMDGLSSRELQILKLAAVGRSKLQIANALAQRMLIAVQAAQARSWTADEVALILRWLTPYPGQEISIAEARRAETLLRELGGPQEAQQRLEQIAEHWQERYPLHSEILQKFLAGWERRQIVRHVVAQGFYEDSRIYACIKELPYRISRYLRRAQATRESAANPRE
jgi:hypothetical protein